MNHNIDHGPEPFVIDIDCAAKENSYFRRTLWTGSNLQLTLMSIPYGDDIGCEIHSDTDQFFYCAAGSGTFITGCNGGCHETCTSFQEGDAIFVPEGTWHNIINAGNCALKLYSIYAPPHHPHGTLHRTKADANSTYDNCRCNTGNRNTNRCSYRYSR